MNWGIKSQGRCPLLSDDMGSVHDIPQFENDVIPRHSLSMSCTRNINIYIASHFYLIKKIHALNIFIEQAWYIGSLIFQIYLHSCFFFNRKIGIYLHDSLLIHAYHFLLEIYQTFLFLLKIILLKNVNFASLIKILCHLKFNKCIMRFVILFNSRINLDVIKLWNINNKYFCFIMLYLNILLY